jgi:hypothetical protein
MNSLGVNSRLSGYLEAILSKVPSPQQQRDGTRAQTVIESLYSLSPSSHRLPSSITPSRSPISSPAIHPSRLCPPLVSPPESLESLHTTDNKSTAALTNRSVPPLTFQLPCAIPAPPALVSPMHCPAPIVLILVHHAVCAPPQPIVAHSACRFLLSHASRNFYATCSSRVSYRTIFIILWCFHHFSAVVRAYSELVGEDEWGGNESACIKRCYPLSCGSSDNVSTPTLTHSPSSSTESSSGDCTVHMASFIDDLGVNRCFDPTTKHHPLQLSPMYHSEFYFSPFFFPLPVLLCYIPIENLFV